MITYDFKVATACTNDKCPPVLQQNTTPTITLQFTEYNVIILIDINSNHMQQVTDPTKIVHTDC